MSTKKAIREGAAEGLRRSLLRELLTFDRESRGPDAKSLLRSLGDGYGISEVRVGLKRLERDGEAFWRMAMGVQHWTLSNLGRMRAEQLRIQDRRDARAAEAAARLGLTPPPPGCEVACMSGAGHVGGCPNARPPGRWVRVTFWGRLADNVSSGAVFPPMTDEEYRAWAGRVAEPFGFTHVDGLAAEVVIGDA